MNLALALSRVPKHIETIGGYFPGQPKNEFTPDLRREIVCIVIMCRLITPKPRQWPEIMDWLVKERGLVRKSKSLASTFHEWIRRGLI